MMAAGITPTRSDVPAKATLFEEECWDDIEVPAEGLDHSFYTESQGDPPSGGGSPSALGDFLDGEGDEDMVFGGEYASAWAVGAQTDSVPETQAKLARSEGSFPEPSGHFFTRPDDSGKEEYPDELPDFGEDSVDSRDMTMHALAQPHPAEPAQIVGTIQRLTPKSKEVIQRDGPIHAWMEETTVACPNPTTITPSAEAAEPTPSASHTDKLEAMDIDMDDDFDLPTDITTLRLADRTIHKAPEADMTGHLDSICDGWSDSLSVHKDLPSLRMLHSPTPSSTASMIASESEEDGFDDLEFPETVEALRLGTYHHSMREEIVEPDKDDEDPLEGLLIPEEDTLDPARLGRAGLQIPSTPVATTPQTVSNHAHHQHHHHHPAPQPPRHHSDPRPQSQTPSPTKSTTSTSSLARTLPSKIPRIIPSPLPTRPPRLSISTRLSHPPTPTAISPSVGHIQRLTSHYITTRRMGSDANTAPSRLLRKPKNSPMFGDGSELDGIEDLVVRGEEGKGVRKAGGLVATPAKGERQNENVGGRGSQKRTLSKAGSAASLVSTARMIVDERENRRPYTSIPPVNHRPAKTFYDRRGPPPPPAHRKRPKKKPMLIRNLNNSDTVKVVGNMVYNPLLQKWEGNESALLDFDRTAATPTRPALITNVGGYKMPQTVGGMVFDPVTMRWLGNEEEADVFGDLADDVASVHDNGLGTTSDRSEFALPASLRESLCIAEASHKLFMAKWYPRAVLDSQRTMMRDTSKTHLYEIRSHAKPDRERRRNSAIWR
ncbi:uncharacterized protein EV422DRAFT_164939 [Fimicolochytrium jonesii]|uniref:uncharacterized protein n=1 Tax=Fimicolochytrium jonesii TaxID=1396493 RepID=UPI0022FE3C02|nr:uncharacterized protein EV422DRAFT_164939 [Fimicolochytrium jonesii]KAI8818785.1 hypothetical protein EV422DRAFT_164939 [Fimicolochytrium jonesii]